MHDASDMATTLRQLGFEVTLLRDAARRPMVEAIDLFSRQLRQGGVGVFILRDMASKSAGRII